MRLTVEQICSIATGAVYIEEKENGLEFHRFSREQEQFFYKPHKYFTEEFFTAQFGACYFGLLAQTTAGITFDFYTDAKAVKIEIGELIIPVDAKKQCFDVFVNNKYKASYEGDKNFCFSLNSGKNRVTIYFPWVNNALIKGVALQNATNIEPVHKGVDVLCIGDSITHGGNSLHPGTTWVTVMARKLSVSVINQGLCGFVNDERAVERVCSPKLVITAYGVNDYGRKTDEQLKEETDAYIKKVKECYPEAKVFSILPIWTAWNTNPGNWCEEKRFILKSVYERNGVHIIDGMKMIPHNVKYLEDGVVHPNEAGFTYYGNRVAKIIKEFL